MKITLFSVFGKKAIKPELLQTWYLFAYPLPLLLKKALLPVLYYVGTMGAKQTIHYSLK